MPRRGGSPGPTLLEAGTPRISLRVREVDGGGLADLVRLDERALVTFVLLEERDRLLLEVGGGRLPDLLPRSEVDRRVLAERSRSLVDTRLRLEDRPRLVVLAWTE